MAGVEILPSTAGMVAFLVAPQVPPRLQILGPPLDQMADVVPTLVARRVIPMALMADAARSMGMYISPSKWPPGVHQVVVNFVVD
jgi:hypothetical protein